MKTITLASALLVASAAFALDIHSTGFSTFTDALNLPAAVNETKTFGSDSWWGGGEKFGPWELSPDSKPYAMGEDCWTGNMPSWDGEKWSGDIIAGGSHVYDGFFIYVYGNIEPNNDPDSTIVRVSGQADGTALPSGESIGSERFWMTFTRTREKMPAYAPAARLDDVSESALYHVLDAALERRFFAGEYTNHTWSVETYGPRGPKKAWFHISDDTTNPLGSNPGRECYYSPQPGVSMNDDTNRVIFTRRFVEYDNIISNFVAMDTYSDACRNRLHYPTVGTMPEETLWSSSYLWKLWENGAPQEVTSWRNATKWDAEYWPNLMPCIRGLKESPPINTEYSNGYQNKYIFPEDHCFGHGEIISARVRALGLDKNPRGRLMLPASPSPIDLDCAGFIASNFNPSAYNYLSNTWVNTRRPTRRFDPTFLAGWSQWIALMNKTQTTSQSAMDTTVNVGREYRRLVYLQSTIRLSTSTDLSAVAGGWELNDHVEINEHISDDWKITSQTNRVDEAEVTNAAPQKCSAWVHLDTPEDTCSLICESFSFGEGITGGFLSGLSWSIVPTNGTNVVITHSCYQNPYSLAWFEQFVVGEAAADYEVSIPYGEIYPRLRAATSRTYAAEISRHVTTDFQFQPGPYARSNGVVGNAELWGFHTYAVQNNHFGRVWGVSNSCSTFLRGEYINPANVESDIITPWYNFISNQCVTVTGFGDPWARIDYGLDVSKDRLASAWLPRGTFFRFQETDESANTKILANISWPDITITGYIDPAGVTQRVDSVLITWEVLSEDRPEPGTNEFPRVSAISADAKSTVTQVIDWKFNSLDIIETNNE